MRHTNITRGLASGLLTLAATAGVAGAADTTNPTTAASAVAPAAVSPAGPATPATPAGAPAASGSEAANGADSIPANMAPTNESDAPPPANLMSLLGKLGVGKPLSDAGFNIYGHVEGGYTYEFIQPSGNPLLGRDFDFLSNRGLLNQATLNLTRVVPLATDHFDIGGRIQVLEGTDAGVTQAYKSFNQTIGLESNAMLNVGGNNSSYQLDVPDAYVDVGIPLGRGLRVRAGRFEFFKSLDADDRIFYSTTYAYTAALPVTNTGVLLGYSLSDTAGVYAGFSRGYNITVDDSNGSIDFLGKFYVDLSDRTSFTAATEIGPNLPHNNTDYTTLVNLSLSHKFTDQVSLGLDGIFSHQFGNSLLTQNYNPFSPYPPTPYVAGSIGYHLPASYYGVAGTLLYELNAYVSVAGRAEWFRDDGGLYSGISSSFYETTLGTTITPFPKSAIGQNFKFRPELRWDYTNRAAFGPVGDRKNQFTVGTDVLYTF